MMPQSGLVVRFASTAVSNMKVAPHQLRTKSLAIRFKHLAAVGKQMYETNR
jgi:hypothetical protein